MLLSDWLRKHFGAKPEPLPQLAVPMPSLTDSLRAWDHTVELMMPVLERAGITAIVIRTDERGQPGNLIGSAVTPKALDTLLDWGRKTLHAMPQPVLQ